MFFSFFASLQNWRAFLVYGVAVSIFAGLVPGTAFSILAVAMRGAQGAAGIMSTLALVVVVILLPTLYASFYASYRDVFADQPAE